MAKVVIGGGKSAVVGHDGSGDEWLWKWWRGLCSLDCSWAVGGDDCGSVD